MNEELVIEASRLPPSGSSPNSSSGTATSLPFILLILSIHVSILIAIGNSPCGINEVTLKTQHQEAFGEMAEFPRMFRVRQRFEGPELAEVAAAVESELSGLALSETVRPGQTVAITAGSRGIANIERILQAAVRHFRRLGASPFIVPAMGSHGGGTAEGQRKILESYGITEAFCGCPIRSSMDTVQVCRAAEGFPVHFDKQAYQADHVVVCNRVKPHTLFTGEIESGLMKMMLIGLGKHDGARVCHRAIKDYSFGQIVGSVAREVLSKCSILAGLAVVENSYGRTARIRALGPEALLEGEKALLREARRWMPRLPFQAADILLVDEIGKNISGSGLDLNVVGRKHLWHQPAEHEVPKIRLIGVRDLSRLTHGSAVGIGTVEFCRSRALERMDVGMTRVNALTGGFTMEAMIPLDYPTDRKMLQVMLSQIGLTEPPDARLLWIRNTMSLAEVECSAAYLEEARGRKDLAILTDPRPLSFNVEGNLDDRHMQAGTRLAAAARLGP